MRKRIRKKQSEGEFSEYAFGVSYVLDDVPSLRANQFLDLFVDQAIEPNGLECRGSRHDSEWDFRVACVDNSKPTVAQRAAVRLWLKSREELSRFVVEDAKPSR